MTTRVDLPTARDVNTRGAWELPVGRAGQVHLLADATFLGFGSTERTKHTNHASDYATPGVKCPACRWYESRLFKVHDEHAHHYVVHHVGASVVPGEVYLHRYEDAWSAHEVIELFTIRPHPDDSAPDARPRAPFLTRPGAHVLAVAAGFDEEVSFAYVNRAVE